MCVLAISHRSDPTYRFAVAANRDEHRSRTAEPLHAWAGADLAAGRDVRGGGTWLAMSPSGRFAAVTNIREAGPASTDARSRGDLPVRFVRGSISAEEFTRAAISAGGDYNGFNLVCRDEMGVWVCSNRGMAEPRRLDPGLHGFSNGPAVMAWPKSDRISSALKRLSDAHSDEDATTMLLAALRDTDPVDEGFLPDTGLDPVLERQLSAPFVCLDNYGTRCSTIILLRHDRSGIMTELTYDASGRPRGRHSIRLTPEGLFAG